MIATQAAVEAVLSAATPRDETKETKPEEESMEVEPPHKRQALGIDFTSLVKEAVYDDPQVQCIVLVSNSVTSELEIPMKCFWPKTSYFE